MEQLVGLPRIFIALCITPEVSFVFPRSCLVRGLPDSACTCFPSAVTSISFLIQTSSGSGSYKSITPLRVRNPLISLKGLGEAEPELGFPPAACGVSAGACFRSPWHGVLLLSLAGPEAAEVTPCSLHRGSVRSCVLRIPVVQMPDASLHSLHSPTMIVTMSRSMPTITNVWLSYSPAQPAGE